MDEARGSAGDREHGAISRVTGIRARGPRAVAARGVRVCGGWRRRRALHPRQRGKLPENISATAGVAHCGAGGLGAGTVWQDFTCAGSARSGCLPAADASGGRTLALSEGRSVTACLLFSARTGLCRSKRSLRCPALAAGSSFTSRAIAGSRATRSSGSKRRAAKRYA